MEIIITAVAIMIAVANGGYGGYFAMVVEQTAELGYSY